MRPSIFPRRIIYSAKIKLFFKFQIDEIKIDLFDVKNKIQHINF